MQALVVRKATSPSSKIEIQAVKHALAVMAGLGHSGLSLVTNSRVTF